MTEITVVYEQAAVALECPDEGARITANTSPAAIKSEPYAGLQQSDWERLPPAVRRRFSASAVHPAARIYSGRVILTELSRAGRLLANLARLVGGPMPFTPGAVGPSVVTVTNVAHYGADHISAQVWTRSYARPAAFPQVIQSAKCFAGPTGLEERLGFGLVMRLAVSVQGEAGAAELVFSSVGFLIRLGPFALTLPPWLSPGQCEVRHRDEGGGEFTFTLTITHPWLGRLVRQVARYGDM